jgi:hypothetical protein
MSATWTITLETDHPTSEHDAVALTERLDAHAGAVSYNDNSTSVTITIDAPDPPDAIAQAIDITRAAGLSGGVIAAEARDADLPDRAWPELVGIRELAELLDVSRQRASELQTRPGFPRPCQVLASGPVWVKPVVEHWVATWDRKGGRPRKADSRSMASKRT